MDTICDLGGLVVQPELSADDVAAKLTDSSAEKLFSAGELLSALDATYYEIPQCGDDPERALRLWYIRVQSMLILQYKIDATKEITHNLGVLNDSSEAYADFVRLHLTSRAARWQCWRLRLILVPVHVGRINQAAIQMYYDMSDEARIEASHCEGSLQNQWLQGIELAGLYVVSALVTLKDYRSAIALVAGHYRATRSPNYATLISTLYLMVGDALSAQSWLLELPADDPGRLRLTDLTKFAENGTCRIDSAFLADIYEGRLTKALSQLNIFAEYPPMGILELAHRTNSVMLQKILKRPQ